MSTQLTSNCTCTCPQTNWFDRLSSSLQALVLSHLSDLELCGLSAVSKDWAAVLRRASVWRPVFQQQYADRAQGGKDAWYASSPDLELKLPTLSWREVCVNLDLSACLVIVLFSCAILILAWRDRTRTLVLSAQTFDHVLIFVVASCFH